LGILVLDNLSPFTPDILACLDRLGVQYVCRQFSEASHKDVKKCDRVILSGRRKNDPAINAANSRIIMQCHGSDKPLLGICYGAEIIALTFGGSIRRMPGRIVGQIEIDVEAPNALTDGKASISAYESHGFCVARLPAGFERLAGSQYCEYEIFAHREKRIYGTQFHPEKSGQDGLDLIASFARL
jgi:GMP synthase (glutamine-hydrolysing)